MSGDRMQPELPYADGPESDGTAGRSSGWSGSVTSRDRARARDAGGQTAEMQARIVALLIYAQSEGMTWRDVAARTGAHHGSVSGALTVLHKAGRIARLAESRERCRIYVHPNYVDGRVTETAGTNTNAATLAAIRAMVARAESGDGFVHVSEIAAALNRNTRDRGNRDDRRGR